MSRSSLRPHGREAFRKKHGLKMRVVALVSMVFSCVAFRRTPSAGNVWSPKHNGGNHNWGIERCSPHPLREVCEDSKGYDTVDCWKKSGEKTSWGEGSWFPIIYKVLAPSNRWVSIFLLGFPGFWSKLHPKPRWRFDLFFSSKVGNIEMKKPLWWIKALPLTTDDEKFFIQFFSEDF